MSLGIALAVDRMKMEYHPMAGVCCLSWVAVLTLVALILVAEPSCAAEQMAVGMSFLPFESDILSAAIRCDFAYVDAQSSGPLALLLDSA